MGAHEIDPVRSGAHIPIRRILPQSDRTLIGGDCALLY